MTSTGLRHVSVVRPFPARIVRQDRAARLVTPLSEAPEVLAGLHHAADPEAYDVSAAALYVYRQRRGSEAYTGLVCDVSTEAFLDGRVRGHESVRPERVEALVRHFATTPDRPALVALLHRAGPVVTRTIDATTRTPPTLDFTGPGGLQQTVWRVTGGTAALSEELGAAAHYIADGHHRVAASLEEWRLAGMPPGAGLLCVVYPMDGLRLSPFHRWVTGRVDPAELRSLLSRGFHVREVGAAPTPAHGSFGVYVDHTWLAVRFRGPRPDGPSGLDAAVLNDRVLAHLVDDRTGPSTSLEFVPESGSVAELVQRCDHDGGALFTLAPPTLADLTGLADRGHVMPPKTTYFEPKPCAGIFLRHASDEG